MELHAQIACAMPRELLGRGIGWQTRAVYLEAVLYCRENLSDGRIKRGQMTFWMPDLAVRNRVGHLDTAAEAGALVVDGEDWLFPDHVWRRWNPLRSEVDARRAAETERKRRYRDRRQPRDAASEHVPMGRSGRATSRAPLSEPEPEPEPEPSSSSSQPDPRPTGTKPDDDEDRRSTTLIVEMRAAANPPRNRSAWERTVRADIAATVNGRIAELLAAGHHPIEVAGLVEGDPVGARIAARHLGWTVPGDDQ